MHFTSWVFPKGHRIRFAVSNAQWPMIWPTPYPMTTKLCMGARTTRVSSCPSSRRPERPSPQLPAARTAEPRRAARLRDARHRARRRATARSRRSTATRAPGKAKVVATSTSAHALSLGRGAQRRVDHARGRGPAARRRPRSRASTATEVKLPDRTLRWRVRRDVPKRPGELLLFGRAQAHEGRHPRAREELGDRRFRGTSSEARGSGSELASSARRRRVGGAARGYGDPLRPARRRARGRGAATPSSSSRASASRASGRETRRSRAARR